MSMLLHGKVYFFLENTPIHAFYVVKLGFPRVNIISPISAVREKNEMKLK